MDSIDRKGTPVFGCSQPDIGQKLPVALKAMGQPRGSKVVSHAARKTREAMVAKLDQLIAREYQGIAKSTAYERIEEATGISLSSMQRIMSGRTGPSIDTLSDLARHLGTTVAEILASPKDPFPKEPSEHLAPKPRPPSRTPTY